MGNSKVHASGDGRTTVCGRLIPVKIARVTVDEPAISCRRCVELLENREYNRKTKEKRLSPQIKYKGGHGDFIKLYNDIQGICEESKGFGITPHIIEKLKAKIKNRLMEEVDKDYIREGTVEIDVRQDPHDPTRLVVDFLPAGDALEETVPNGQLPHSSEGGNGPSGRHFVFRIEGTGAPDILLVGPDGQGGTIAVGAWMTQSKPFVLSPEEADQYGAASRVAMAAYATSIEETDPRLARELMDWLREIGLR